MTHAHRSPMTTGDCQSSLGEEWIGWGDPIRSFESLEVDWFL